MPSKFWKFQYPEEPDRQTPEKKKQFFENLLHRAIPLMLSGLAVLAAAAPGAFAFWLFQKTVPLFSMAGLTLAGLMSAPFYGSMTHLIMLFLADEPGYFGPHYKEFLQCNWKKSLPIGAMFGFVLAAILLALRLFSFAEQWKILFFAASFVDLEVFFAVLTVMASIAAAPGAKEERLRPRQVLAKLAQHPQRAALGALVQIVYWLAIYLLFPYSGYLLPFFSAWVPALLGLWQLRR